MVGWAGGLGVGARPPIILKTRPYITRPRAQERDGYRLVSARAGGRGPDRGGPDRARPAGCLLLLNGHPDGRAGRRVARTAHIARIARSCQVATAAPDRQTDGLCREYRPLRHRLPPGSRPGRSADSDRSGGRRFRSHRAGTAGGESDLGRNPRLDGRRRLGAGGLLEQDAASGSDLNAAAGPRPCAASRDAEQRSRHRPRTDRHPADSRRAAPARHSGADLAAGTPAGAGSASTRRDGPPGHSDVAPARAGRCDVEQHRRGRHSDAAPRRYGSAHHRADPRIDAATCRTLTDWPAPLPRARERGWG